jgi:hypothetical protein
VTTKISKSHFHRTATLPNLSAMLKYAGRLIYGKIVVPETLTYKRETALATEPFSPNGLCREHQEAFANASRGIRPCS